MQQDVVAGRLRDAGDRIAWLLEHSRYEQALTVAESDPVLKPAIRQQVCLCSASASCECIVTQTPSRYNWQLHFTEARTITA